MHFARALPFVLTSIAFVSSLSGQAVSSTTSAQLDNPHAIAPAQALYTYLYNLSRSEATTGKLISGHWHGSSFKPGHSNTFTLQETLEIRRHTGKWIGMLDGWISPDFSGKPEQELIDASLWYLDMVPEYILWWRNGGIVHAGATFAAPLADRYGQRLEKDLRVDIEPILTPGTLEHRHWRTICERMSLFFKALEVQNVPVIFRPFTEAYISQYWYSNHEDKLGNGGSIRLYRDLHDYLTKEKHCNNILWEFQGSKADPHYPGDAYVDVYGTKSEYVAWKVASFQTLSEDDIPMGNAELGDYGVSPRADEAGKPRISWLTWVETIKRQCPRLSFYITWNKVWGPTKRICEDGTYCDYDHGYDELIANDYVLTRDELTIAPQPSKKATLEGAGQWIVSRGTWTEQHGTIRRTEATGEGKLVRGNTDWTDYAFQAKVVVPATGEVGLLGRCASTTLFYELALAKDALILYRSYDGQIEKIDSWSHAFNPSEAITLKLDFRGTRIEGYVDTGSGLEKRIAVDDPTIPCGCIGLRANDSAAHFTDLQMSD